MVRWALCFMVCTLAPSAQGAELTIDRLFDAPSLSGPTITALKIAPDSSRITFLRGKDSDKDRLDLWEYHLGSAATVVYRDNCGAK